MPDKVDRIAFEFRCWYILNNIWLQRILAVVFHLSNTSKQSSEINNDCQRMIDETMDLAQTIGPMHDSSLGDFK
jgi:hypothetical protein